jgi:membrane associated rhomboid family serine protease
MSISIALLLIVIFSATTAGRLQLPPMRGPVPWLTLSLVAALALALVAQLLFPPLIAQVQRDAGAIRHGEIYRLFTALWFQDGGVAGSLFNLAILFLLGSVSERLWDRRAWLILYFGTGLAAECIALAWKPIGAGNSVACFGLAGGILALGGLGGRLGGRVEESSRIVTALRVVGLGAGAALALMRDIHGAALLIGAVLGLLLFRTGWRLSGGADQPSI